MPTSYFHAPTQTCKHIYNNTHTKTKNLLKTSAKVVLNFLYLPLKQQCQMKSSKQQRSKQQSLRKKLSVALSVVKQDMCVSVIALSCFT